MNSIMTGPPDPTQPVGDISIKDVNVLGMNETGVGGRTQLATLDTNKLQETQLARERLAYEAARTQSGPGATTQAPAANAVPSDPSNNMTPSVHINFRQANLNIHPEATHGSSAMATSSATSVYHTVPQTIAPDERQPVDYEGLWYDNDNDRGVDSDTNDEEEPLPLGQPSSTDRVKQTTKLKTKLKRRNGKPYQERRR